MPDHLFEPLENRSLLSTVTLLTGAPADAAFEEQAITELAELDESGGGDDDMYRFLADTEDAVYELADDAGEDFVGLAADVVAPGAFGESDAEAAADAGDRLSKPTAILSPTTIGRDLSIESKRTAASSTPVQIRFDF